MQNESGPIQLVDEPEVLSPAEEAQIHAQLSTSPDSLSQDLPALDLARPSQSDHGGTAYTTRPRPLLRHLPSQALSDSSLDSNECLSPQELELETNVSPVVHDEEVVASPASTRTIKRPQSEPPSKLPQFILSPGPSSTRQSSRSPSRRDPSSASNFLRHRQSSSLSGPKRIKETLDAQLTTDFAASDEDAYSTDGGGGHQGSMPTGFRGRKLNQYRIGDLLGKGSAASVEIAVDDQGHEYAIKEFSKSQLRKRRKSEALRRSRGKSRAQKQEIMTGEDLEEKIDALALIRMEIAIMKKLDHPNLVKLYEVLNVQDSDSLYMVLELCKGGPLTTVTVNPTESHHEHVHVTQDKITSHPKQNFAVGSCTRMDEDTACNYFRQIVLGVEYLHANGIVHRDIKPENILLMEDRVVCKIVDFGVSEMFMRHGDDVMTKSVGSPAFMSPELCHSHHGMGVHARAADIWAMGVTLYCITVGHLPFQSTNFLDLSDLIMNAPAEIPTFLSPELQGLLKQLLEKNPEKRITMDKLREHAWLTRGNNPMPSKEDNTSAIEAPTGTELQEAFAPATIWEDIYAAIKASRKLKRIAGQRLKAKRGISLSMSDDVFSDPSSVTSTCNSGLSSMIRGSDSRRSSAGTSSLPEGELALPPRVASPPPSSSVTSTVQSQSSASPIATTDSNKSSPLTTHGRTVSIDDNYLETVRYVEDQLKTEVVKRGEELSRRAGTA